MSDSSLPATTDQVAIPQKDAPAPGTPTTEADFTITLSVGSDDTRVTLHSKSLSEIEKTGLHFELPPGSTVTLGSLKDLIVWLNKQLPLALPTEAGQDWPDFAKTIVNTVLKARVTITRFTVDQDPKDKDDKWPPVRFIFDVFAEPMGPDDKPANIVLVEDLFSVVGTGVSVTRTYEGAPKGPAGPRDPEALGPSEGGDSALRQVGPGDKA